jgi:pilus assembly protein Flp/PilA
MLSKVRTTFQNLRRDEEGATMVEYGLLVALIAMVALVGITLLGTNLQSLYTTVAGSV